MTVPPVKYLFRFPTSLKHVHFCWLEDHFYFYCLLHKRGDWWWDSRGKQRCRSQPVQPRQEVTVALSLILSSFKHFVRQGHSNFIRILDSHVRLLVIEFIPLPHMIPAIEVLSRDERPVK